MMGAEYLDSLHVCKILIPYPGGDIPNTNLQASTVFFCQHNPAGYRFIGKLLSAYQIKCVSPINTKERK